MPEIGSSPPRGPKSSAVVTIRPTTKPNLPRTSIESSRTDSMPLERCDIVAADITERLHFDLQQLPSISSREHCLFCGKLYRPVHKQ